MANDLILLYERKINFILLHIELKTKYKYLANIVNYKLFI